jgi:2-polyprenyl-3-methyl-5-hydroxy-6-metoxy-1,4-benzoquinol methylase
VTANLHDADNDARRAREAEHHDRAMLETDLESTLVDETFTAITAQENQYILSQFGDVKGLSILDYGSGVAEGGIYLAKLGARVVAVDVSEGQLEGARKLAKHHGVEIETRLVTSDRIPAADSEFDRIYGNGVLHHVPHDTAVPELARVLKPNGIGCFIEPLPYNPAIQVYRKLASAVRTVDEQPLSMEDIERLGSGFDKVEHREFWFSTLLVFFKFFLWDRVSPNKERYWKKIYSDASSLEAMVRPLRKLDDTLLRSFPPLGRLCWTTVITLSKPRKG